MGKRRGNAIASGTLPRKKKVGRKSYRKPDKRSGSAGTGVDYSGATKAGCSSGKWGWSERAGAKTLEKALRNQGSSRMRTYRCPECNLFHVGHFPKVVSDGEMSTRDVFAPRGRREPS